MSGSISFTNIPPNIRIPLTSVEFDATQAIVANGNAQNVLLIGQSLVTQPYAPVFAASLAQVQSLAGRGSMLARMVAAYRGNDGFGQVWILPVAEPSGGVANVQTVTITGAPTAAGTLALYIGSTSVPIAVGLTDTPTTIAAAIAAAVTANPDLPVTAAAAAGVVTLTHKHKGVVTGYTNVQLNYYGAVGGEMTPPGITVAIATTTAGTGAPDVSGLDGVLKDAQFDFIGTPYGDSASLAAIATLMSFSAGRWAPTRKVYGHAYSAVPGTVSTLQTFGGTLDDPHTSVFGYEPCPTPPEEAVAMALGQIAPAIAADPARPLQTLQLQGFLPAAANNRFTKSQQQALLSAGIATLSYVAGDAFIQRAVTTYQANPLGQPDTSYLDSETLYTLMAVTRQLIGAFQTKYPRSKLADDGTRFSAGQPIVTPSVALGEIAAQYNIMEFNGLVEDADSMLKATIVQRNLTDPTRLDILWAPFLVSGLRQLAIKNQFRLYSAAALAAATGVAA